MRKKINKLPLLLSSALVHNVSLHVQNCHLLPALMGVFSVVVAHSAVGLLPEVAMSLAVAAAVVVHPS